MSQGTSCVYVCDNADLDNEIGAIAAARLLNLKMVVVTGRHTGQGDMRQIMRWNAARMRGTLDSFGFRRIPVYTALVPPETIVPDKIHVKEWIDLDPKGYCNTKQPNGDFAAATRQLYRLARSGPVDLIGAGPLGEISRWLDDPKLRGCFGILTCQYGPMGFGNVATMGGGKLGFNGACDPIGARNTLLHPGITGYLNTTDTTKMSSVGFKHPREMAALGVDEELVEPTTRFWELAQEPRNEDSFPHDAHPVFAQAQLRGNPSCSNMFNFKEVVISSIGPRGELNATFGTAPEGVAKRYVATSVNASRFKTLLGSVCRKK